MRHQQTEVFDFDWWQITRKPNNKLRNSYDAPCVSWAFFFLQSIAYTIIKLDKQCDVEMPPNREKRHTTFCRFSRQIAWRWYNSDAVGATIQITVTILDIKSNLVEATKRVKIWNGHDYIRWHFSMETTFVWHSFLCENDGETHTQNEIGSRSLANYGGFGVRKRTTFFPCHYHYCYIYLWHFCANAKMKKKKEKMTVPSDTVEINFVLHNIWLQLLCF